MDEIKLIGSLSSLNLVRRKSNDLDSKEKEKAYENPKKEKKINEPSQPEKSETGDNSPDDDQPERKTVDVFI